MTLDVTARATAQKLLGKFGKSATYRRAGAGVYDPSTGLVSSSDTVITIKLYIDQPNKSEQDSGLVVVTDEVAIVAGKDLAFKPSPTDRLTIDGRDRQIKMVSAVWSGEQVALWRIGLSS